MQREEDGFPYIRQPSCIWLIQEMGIEILHRTIVQQDTGSCYTPPTTEIIPMIPLTKLLQKFSLCYSIISSFRTLLRDIVLALLHAGSAEHCSNDIWSWPAGTVLTRWCFTQERRG